MSRVAIHYDSPSWTEVQMCAALGAAAGAVVLGARRQPLAALCLGAAATAIGYQALARHWPSSEDGEDANAHTRSALAGTRGIHLRESVRLECPVEDVYEYWRRLENLPRFMRHVEEVTETPNGRSHWVARGPAGIRVEWDAEIINEVPNRLIGWRSVPGSDIVAAGSVNFARARNGRATQITVHMQYAPPAGRAGAFLATIFGQAPSAAVREDLRRLKQFLEAGEYATGTQSEAETRP
jgi:uncharacterized membrane protein